MTKPSTRRAPLYRVVAIDENAADMHIHDGRIIHYRAQGSYVWRLDYTRGGVDRTQVCERLSGMGHTLHAPQPGETLATVIRREARRHLDAVARDARRAAREGWGDGTVRDSFFNL